MKQTEDNGFTHIQQLPLAYSTCRGLEIRENWFELIEYSLICLFSRVIRHTFHCFRANKCKQKWEQSFFFLILSHCGHESSRLWADETNWFIDPLQLLGWFDRFNIHRNFNGWKVNLQSSRVTEIFDQSNKSWFSFQLSIGALFFLYRAQTPLPFRPKLPFLSNSGFPWPWFVIIFLLHFPMTSVSGK